tara:strand:- start:437 stop:640 length:204 start_codon:yes stop_codon:yes gene_type:complete
MASEEINHEEAAFAFQQQASDRLILFRLNQSCVQDILNYTNQRIAQLEKDMAEVSAATRARLGKKEE